jgi:hypothetical protein
MATLSFSPAAISTTIRIAAAPLNVRTASGRPQTATFGLTVMADPPLGQGGVVNLDVVNGDVPWLECQSECNDDDPFSVEIDASAVEIVGCGEQRLNAVVRATADGYTSADLPVSVLVLPGGMAAKR